MIKSIVLIFFLVITPSFVLFSNETGDERLAAQYFRNGQYEKAAAIYEDLFDENSTEVIYRNYLKSLLELEEFRKATNVVEERIENNPFELKYQVDLGYVMMRSGNNRRANRHFNRLVDDLPDQPHRVISLAEAFLNIGENELALKTYKNGRDKFGRSNPFNKQIAQIYKMQGEYEKMMDEYVDLITISPDEMDKIRGILQDELNNDPEFKKNDALRKVLLRRSQQRGADTIFSEMLLWLSIQQKDFEMALRQARGLDRRLQRGGEIIFDIAELSLANNAFDVAEKAFNYIIDIGDSGEYYIEAQVGLLDTKFKRLTSSHDYNKEDLIDVENAYKEALEKFGIHVNTVSLIRNLANIKAFYLGKSDEAVQLLQKVIDMRRVHNTVKAECRVEMADILVLTGDVWDAKLLYSRVDREFKDNPIGHEAKYKNARLSFYIGEFDWAKAQLDVLKSATSKLIANDAMALSLKIQDNIGFDNDTKPLEMYAKAERMVFMNRFDEAFNILDSIIHKFPNHQIKSDILYTKAEINLRISRYEKADSLFSALVEKYPDDILADEALFKQAELNENILNNPEKASELYRKLMVDYTGSTYNHIARNRYRKLRDNKINL